MDRLDQLIEQTKREVAMLVRYAQNPNAARIDLDRAKATLAAFELAAAVRPAVNGAAPEETEQESDETPKEDSAPTKRGGKPPGAISESWKNLLRRMHADGNPFRTEEWILAAAKKAKIEADPKSIVDRLSRKYVNQFGYLEFLEEEGFRVTPIAIARFELG